jgi:16S rRNA (cytosine1402-N4)-methyltransferase
VHVPVLSKESIELLNPQPGNTFVDCTLGAGGHTRLILQRIAPNGRMLAIDRDEAAVEAARVAFSDTAPPPTFVHGDFRDLTQLAHEAGVQAAHGVLFDLGLSSVQLDDPERGFSFRQAGPLDMRMDRHQPIAAAQVVNQLPERELAEVIRRLGEERWAARVAKFIAARRPLRSTRDLAAAVEAAIPRGAWPPDLHPATRTFQAIRMHVNDELGSLEGGLRGALEIVQPGGRIAVISFHSLEDRLVKSFFLTESRDCLCPPEQPVCTCHHRASLRVLTRRPVRPTTEEVAGNPRSRSARLRAAERL